MDLDKTEFEDQWITCIECGEKFLFEAGEKSFFFAKKLSPRRRCKACVKARRATLIPDQDAWKGVRQ